MEISAKSYSSEIRRFLLRNGTLSYRFLLEVDGCDFSKALMKAKISTSSDPPLIVVSRSLFVLPSGLNPSKADLCVKVRSKTKVIRWRGKQIRNMIKVDRILTICNKKTRVAVLLHDCSSEKICPRVTMAVFFVTRSRQSTVSCPPPHCQEITNILQNKSVKEG